MTDPACVVGNAVKSVTAGAAGDVLNGIAQAITAGVRWIVVNTATWWVRIPSPNLAAEPAVAHLQQWLLPVTGAVAVAGVIAAGARMAIARRANPLLDVTGGLLTLAAATTVGTVVPALLIKAGDAWSTWVLQVSTGGQFSQRLADVLTLGGSAAPAVVLIFGIVAIVMSIVQAVLMLFRQAALIILAGVLPLAAAGSITPLTRTWIRNVSAWMLALIFYKPAAAAVYATTFTMIGSGGSVQTVVTGFVMLLLSVLTLPALMRFFTWTTGSIAGSGGGGQLLGAAAVGAVAIGSMRSSPGGAAQDQAAFMNSRLGPPPGSSPPGGSPPDGPQGGPPDPGGAGGAGPAGSGPRKAPSGAAAAGGVTPGTGGSSAGPAGAAGATQASPARPAGGGSAGAAAGAGAATGAGAAAGAAGLAAAEAARAASAGTHLATGAMGPEDQG
ncbi:MAG: hypothetical protein ACRDPY_04225 [Streptosporangiaceae bacterium]